MNSGDFYNDPLDNEGMEPDFSYALEKYKEACNEKSENSLLFSEEEFLYIIDYFINNNDEQRVLKVCEMAFAQHSYSSELLIKLIDSLIITGNKDEAAKMLEQYKDSFPQNAGLSFLYCRLAIMNGNLREAREYYEQALFYEQDSANRYDISCTLAQDCIDSSCFEEAIYYLMEANKVEPLSYEYYNDLAFCYERLDKLEQSINYYNKYLDKDPFNDNVWFNLGTVFARQGKYEKAIDAFEYSIALNGGNSSSLYNLAVVYLNLGKYNESVKYFEDFNFCEENSLAGTLGLANAFMGLHNFTWAGETFGRALEIDPGCREAKLGLNANEAIEAYLKGDKERFYLLVELIAKRDFTWINTISKVLPHLAEDEDFIKFVESKINGN